MSSAWRCSSCTMSSSRARIARLTSASSLARAAASAAAAASSAAGGSSAVPDERRAERLRERRERVTDRRGRKQVVVADRQRGRHVEDAVPRRRAVRVGVALGEVEREAAAEHGRDQRVDRILLRPRAELGLHRREVVARVLERVDAQARSGVGRQTLQERLASPPSYRSTLYRANGLSRVAQAAGMQVPSVFPIRAGGLTDESNA